ncbi:MAG: TldD/PmbA family protein [Chloroflexota bacterium]
MENILAQAKKVAEEAEVFQVTSEETPIQFEANRLKHIQSKQRTAVALRLVKQGKLGYATATRLDDSETLVRMAAETAQFGMDVKFDFPTPTTYPHIAVFDPAVGKVPIEAMVTLGEELLAILRRHTPELLCHAWVNKSVTSVKIMNSRGGQASYQQTTFSLSIWGNLIRETDMLFVGDSESDCHPITRPDVVAGAVIEQLERAKNRAVAPTKSLPVIFTPDGVAGALMPSLMAAFNGKLVLEGASPIGSKLGQSCFDAKLSLRDDPTVAYRPTSRPCDDEGVPSQLTSLVEQGVVRNFLYDLQTAARANKQSTGNGQRSGSSLPSPAPSAFIITPGNTTFAEMVSDMQEGLVIEQLMGAEQGNILGGDFSGNVLLGYKVEHGKITGRVKDTMVSGNVYRLLKNINAIGSDTKWVDDSVNTPSLYLSGLSVAGK